MEREIMQLLGQIVESIRGLESNLACVQGNMKELARKVDTMETSLKTTLKNTQNDVKKSLADFKTESSTDKERLSEDVKDTVHTLMSTMAAEVLAVREVVIETRNLVNTSYGKDILKDSLEIVTRDIKAKCNESTNNIKDYIDRTKCEIFAMTEKEAQIVRDRIERPLPSRGKYTFDFYVLDFKSLIRSDKRVRSLPWYINEIRSSIRGYVLLTTDGDMEVWVEHGRRPSMVGLQPVPGNKELKVKATICDIYSKTLPDLEVGERTWKPNETRISTHIHRGWGGPVGFKSCDDILQKGYGDREGYGSGAVLIRYDVTVLPTAH